MAKFIFHTEWYAYCCNAMSSEQFENVIQAVCAFVEGKDQTEYRKYLQGGEENIAFEFITDQIIRERREHPEIFKEGE